MSKEELLQFAKDEFKKIFGDKYDESRAIACVETQLEEKDSVEKAEEAVKAIISRTASKMENFDDIKYYLVKERSGGKTSSWKVLNATDYEAHKSSGIAEARGPFTSEELKKVEKNIDFFDFKPVITDGKKELVVDDSALVLDGKVVKKFDPKTTSLMDIVEMAQKILHSDKLKSTFKKFDDLKQALTDAPAEIKENFNTLAKYFDEKSKLNVNFPKWMLKLGEDTYEVESDGSVKINGEKKDWKVSLTEPLQKILNIFAVKHNEARLNQNPSLTLHDAMEGLKEMLFDAPAEIKQDFNTLVKYFDAQYKVMMHRHTGEHKIIKSEDESEYNHPWTKVYQGTEDKCKSYIKDHAY
jgi:hypothetical protein